MIICDDCLKEKSNNYIFFQFSGIFLECNICDKGGDLFAPSISLKTRD